jgi:thioredoxin-related protein
MGYPTIAYLNKKLDLISPIQGYFEPAEYKKVLQFINEEHFKNQNLDSYIGSR